MFIISSMSLSLDDNSPDDWFTTKEKIAFVYGKKIEELINNLTIGINGLCDLSSGKEKNELNKKIQDIFGNPKEIIEKIERIFTDTVMDSEKSDNKEIKELFEEKYNVRQKEILIAEMKSVCSLKRKKHPKLV
jgi:hypothetical protein